MTDDAAGARVAHDDVAPAVIGWRGITALATPVLATLTLYCVGVLLPYYVNDLHRLPLAEVTGGAHDPKDLWPQNAWQGLLQLAAFLGLALAPLVTLAAVGASGVWLALLWCSPGPQRVITSLALAVLLAASAAALLFLFSETGGSLQAWRLD